VDPDAGAGAGAAVAGVASSGPVASAIVTVASAHLAANERRRRSTLT
jgi:hypothetical protein